MVSGEPDERVSPFSVAGELVEARAAWREQDHVSSPGEIPRPGYGLLEIGYLVDHVLETLVFEVGGDARSGLTLADDGPAPVQVRHYLREVRVFLRTTQDQNYGHVEAGEGRRDRRGVGGLGIVHVGNARDLCDYPHAMGLRLVIEQRLPDLPWFGAEPQCRGGGEEGVLIVVGAGETEPGDVGQSRTAQQQTPVAHGRIAVADDESFRFALPGRGTAHRIYGAHESQVSCPLAFEDTELVFDIFLERCVPVQVIRPHVQERRDFETGARKVVQLERRDFEY